MKQQKLFDDKFLIDKSVVTPSDKKKWKSEFQKYCDSPEIDTERNTDGLNACGYWFACDYCSGSDLPCPCADALCQYFHETGREIDFKNTSHEYLDKLLRGEYDG